MTILHIGIIPLLIIFGVIWALILIIFSIAKKPKKRHHLEEKQQLSELIDRYNETISQFNLQKAGAICTAVYKKDAVALQLIDEENNKFISISNFCTKSIEQLRKALENHKSKSYEVQLRKINDYIKELDLSLIKLGKIRIALQGKNQYNKSNENKQHEKKQYENNQYEKKQYESKQNKDNINTDLGIAKEGYFLGCKTREELEKRHKMLAKAFHPDTGYGDETLFKYMNIEYEDLIKHMRS